MGHRCVPIVEGESGPWVGCAQPHDSIIANLPLDLTRSKHLMTNAEGGQGRGRVTGVFGSLIFIGRSRSSATCCGTCSRPSVSRQAAPRGGARYEQLAA